MAGDDFVLRFAARSEGKRSAIWRCFRPAGKGDVYLGTRTTLPAVKASLHESGRWHVAFDSKYFSRKQSEGLVEKRDRWLHRWERPDLSASPFAVVFRIIMPAVSVITPIQPQEAALDAVWLGVPAVPQSARVSFVFVGAGQPEPLFPHPGCLVFGKDVLPSGDRLFLVHEVGPTPTVSMPAIQGWKQLQHPKPDIPSMAEAGTLRALVSGLSEDGAPFFLDVAVVSGQ